MFSAPISKAVARAVSTSKQRMPRPVTRGQLMAMLLVALTFFSVRIPAQDAAPQFSDVAGRADAARDQGNLPQAISLYSQAVQLKPEWAEGWFYLGMLEYSADSYQPAI